MINPEAAITRARVSFPPGTSIGRFWEIDEFVDLSDQDIAAGRIPNSTKTT